MSKIPLFLLSCAFGQWALAQSAIVPVTVVTTSPLTAGQVSQYVGGDGLPRIAYLDKSDRTLRFVRCNDPQCAGGDEVGAVVADPPGLAWAGLATSVFEGGDGLPVMVHAGTNAAILVDAMHIVRCNDALCNGGDESSSTLGSITASTTGAVQLAAMAGVDGLPFIAFGDEATASLRVMHCNDAACAGGDETMHIVFSQTIDDSGDRRPSFLQVRRGPQGFPQVLFMTRDSPSPPVPWLLDCGDAACSPGLRSLRTIAAGSLLVSRPFRFARGPGAADIPAFLLPYTDSWRLIRCNDPRCSDATRFETVLTEAGIAGCDSGEIAIDSANRPRMAFRCPDGTVRMMICLDAGCASRVFPIADGGRPEQPMALTMGSDDRPHLVYADQGGTGPTKLLRHASCVSRDCLASDVSVQLQAASNPVSPQAVVPLQIRVASTGPSVATTLRIDALLPGEASVTDPAGWACSFIAPLLSCTLDLLPTFIDSVILVDLVAPSAPGAHLLQATVDTESLDGDDTDNAAELSLMVAAPVVDVFADGFESVD